MHLLFLTNGYPPHHGGGYEELCADVSAGLRQRGHTVAVLTSRRGAGGSATADDGVYRLLYPEVDWRRYRATLGFFVGRRRRLQEDLNRLEETLGRTEPDAILVWGMWNLPRQLLVHTEAREDPPVVYYIADYWPSLPDAYTLHWREPARRWYTGLPKYVLGQIALGMLSREREAPALRFQHAACVSSAVRDRLVADGLPLTEARVIHNGIDVARFADAKASRPSRDESERLAVVYAGRLSPEKGVHTAVEAVASLARRGMVVSLTTVGGGAADYERELRSLIERLGLAGQVALAGRVPRERMPEVLARFDVLVVPSIWPEPLPRIVQEGMAAGLAVVGTTVGGMGEILEDGLNGLTFAPGDAEGLARQIERLDVDPALRTRLAQAGVDTVRQRFDIGRMLDELEAYLQEVITGPR